MILFQVTYTVTAPEGTPEKACEEARAQYAYAIEKHKRHFEAVTSGLRRVDDALRFAMLDVAASHCVEYEKGATARRVVEAKRAIRKRPFR